MGKTLGFIPLAGLFAATPALHADAPVTASGGPKAATTAPICISGVYPHLAICGGAV